MNNTLKSILMVAGFAAVTISAQAGAVGFYDDSFDLKLGSSALTSLYESKFGTWNAGTSTFTPLLGNAAISANAGYADATPGALEWAITLSQNNNNNITAGVQLAVVIFNAADDTSYASANHAQEAVLTDPSWLAPTFTPGTPSSLTYGFTASTTAVRGQFTYSAAGKDVVNLSSVPEPSTYAALAGVAVLGLAALRRRRA
jgi:hypothetical protein